MEIVLNSDSDALTKQAGESLLTLLEDRDTPTLLLLSGGSMFRVLEYTNISIDARHITIGVSDERFTKNPKENNFLLLKETPFYKSATANGAGGINTGISFESVEALAMAMENAWRQWLEKNPRRRVVATFGMGPDGHTAGIMPYAEDQELFDILFEDERRFVVGYDARGKNPVPLRATATLPFLRSHVDGGVVYVTGAEKKSPLERVLTPDGTYAETPARVLRNIPNLTLFTDIAL